jgi:SAM-dependent methyltransferase
VADLDAIRESIEHALDPPAPTATGPAHRFIRRVTVRLGRAHAVHQQEVDRRLLAAIASVESRLADTASALQERIGALERRLDPLEALAAIIRAAPDHDALGFELFDAGQAGTVIGYRKATPVSSEEDYLAFEDVFRLSEDVIRERQRPYLSLLREREPVLDAGCGRGEFLELLKKAGVPARGVDLDPGMVAHARAKGLDVEQADIVEYLQDVAEGSLGVVFAAQVVEHLPYARLLAFLRLGYETLMPGGLLIAETVNPHVPTAFKNFWFDLTHQHPVFPEVLLTLCRGIGFGSAYVFHPGGNGDFAADRVWCGDYAIVAERAGASAPPGVSST